MLIKTTEDIAGYLKSAGLRVTSPRIAVLSALQSLGPHQSVEQIADAVRSKLGSVTVQSVYDNLDALASAGLVRKIRPTGAPALYESRVGDNHHHVVCRTCGAVADVDCVVGQAPCLEPDATHGFEIDEAEVIFWGICPDCRNIKSTLLT